uniref:Calx-beta domain-containing protein n=1 Tax=Parascaris equorum TaxID=6256 RepID=A0A914RAD7_PAREQ
MEANFCSFDPACYVCLESAGSVNVRVKCDTEEIDVPVEVTVHYRTIADTAQEYSDFVPTEGILKFEEGQKWQEIRIGIVDNDIYEEDEQFMVCLSQVRAYRSGNTVLSYRKKSSLKFSGSGSDLHDPFDGLTRSFSPP